jgi:uncharacterized protein (DUF1697 family)
MPTHIALLRGINLGGHNKVAMADLRQVVTSLGHGDVATYIQSGNVLFSPSKASTGQAGPAGTAALAAGLSQAVAAELGVQAGVVVLSRDELAQVVADNPYPDPEDLRSVHVIFLPGDPGPGHADWLAASQQKAAEKGSRDEVTLVGRAVYLHTPDGFGRSELAKLLGKAGGPMSAKSEGTARNLATVTKLLALATADQS